VNKPRLAESPSARLGAIRRAVVACVIARADRPAEIVGPMVANVYGFNDPSTECRAETRPPSWESTVRDGPITHAILFGVAYLRARSSPRRSRRSAVLRRLRSELLRTHRRLLSGGRIDGFMMRTMLDWFLSLDVRACF